MKYFRHFSNASTSIKLQRIIDEKGVEGYGRYFLFLELLNEKFDGTSTKVSLHLNEIGPKVRLKFTKSVISFIRELVQFELISVSVSGKVYEIDCPILLELMDRDSKFNRSKRVGNAKRTTLEEEEDKEEDKEGEGDKANFHPSPNKINFSQVVDLFNLTVAGSGKIGHEELLQSGQVVLDFVKKQKEYGLYSGSNWIPIFERIKNSKFLSSELSVRSHFAWLLKDENLKRLLKGDFDNWKKKSGIDELVNPYEFSEVSNG